MGGLSLCREQGLPRVAVRGPLTAVASPAVSSGCWAPVAPGAKAQEMLQGRKLRRCSGGAGSGDAPGARAQEPRGTGLIAPWLVGSSWSRDQTHVPFIGRQILNYWTIRKAWCFIFWCNCKWDRFLNFSFWEFIISIQKCNRLLYIDFFYLTALLNSFISSNRFFVCGVFEIFCI